MVQEERNRKGNRPQFVTQEIQRTMYLCSNSLFGYIQLFSYLTIVQPGFPVEHVRSSCPLRPGLHACYNGRYNGMRRGDAERIPENRSQFGSQSATRLREGGVASNRESATSR